MRPKPTITTVEQLRELRPAPCDEAIEWLAENNITELADAWDRCHRSDWMLWLCSTLDLLSDRELRLIACKCVRETPIAGGGTVWDLLTDDSRSAVVVAERYADGSATDEELAAAYTAAAAKVAAAAAKVAATRAYTAYAAATAAARAVASRAYAPVAAHATAASAAYAARLSASFTSRAAAEAAARAAQADIVRAIVGNPFRDSAE